MYIGIDFGASNLKAMAYNGKNFKNVKLNKNDYGGNHTPNVIFYGKRKNSEDVNKFIGDVALHRGLESNEKKENLIFNIKRKLEEPNYKKYVPALDREITTEEIIFDIFSEIRPFAEKVAKGEELKACVTVPVIFSKTQRDIIKRAVQKAGFTVEKFISEPLGALFSLSDLEDNEFILIFDFGGSTLDISVSRIQISDGETQITEMAAGGIFLGGLDIDKEIYEKLIYPKNKSDIEAAIANGDTSEDIILNFISRMKESLFADEEESIEASDVGDVPTGLESAVLNLTDVENLLENADYKERITELLDSIFEDLSDWGEGYFKEDITRIVPFGGTSQIPFFVKILEEYFGEDKFSAEDFTFSEEDLCANIESRYLAQAAGAAKFLSENVNCVTAHPFKLLYKVGDEFKPAIRKNAPFSFKMPRKPIPIKTLDKDVWKIGIYQSFGNDGSDPVYIGEIQLNESLYEKKESPLIEMQVGRDDNLLLKTFERRKIGDDYEIIPVEKLTLSLE